MASADVAAILQQMQAQAQQQQAQHEAVMQRLIDQTSTPAPATAFGPQQNNGDKGKLIATFFRCQQFTGKAEQWSDFQFRFKRAVRSQSDEAFKMLAEAEVSEEKFHMIGEGNGGLEDPLDERNP